MLRAGAENFQAVGLPLRRDAGADLFRKGLPGLADALVPLPGVVIDKPGVRGVLHAGNVFQHLSEDELFPLVGEDTVRKVTGYKNPGVRRTKLLGEGMIRRLLFRLWGLHKEDYLIRIGEHGKPLVESRFSVWYNLSHSGDYIVAAFSHLEVGIDIEQKRKARMEVARRFFHPAEIQCLQNLAGDAQDELFFRYWSVKESFLKYTGSGLSSPLSGFEVRFVDHRPRIFQSENLRNLSISACPVDPAYKCFVCAETTEEPGIFPFLVPDLFLPDE